MRKPEEEKKGSSRGVFIFLVILLLGVIGGIVWLQGEVETAQLQLDQAKDDYEQMKGWQRSIAKNRAKQKKAGGGAKPPEDPSSILSYLTEKARQSGIPANLTVPIAPEKSPVVKGWRQWTWKFRINGNKENLLTRTSIVKFLQTVQKERPYLKTKDLTIDYQEDKVLKAYVEIYYLAKVK